MRNKLSLLAASAVLTLTAQAAIDLGNGVKVVPNVITSVDFNDNLFLASTNEQDETITRVSPGILFAMGEGALNTAKLSYNEEFQFYNDNSDFNTSLSLVDFSSRYDDGKMKIDVAAWFHEANQATRETAALSRLVKRQLSYGSFVDEVKWTEKTSANAGIVYSNTDYQSASYADWKYFEVPVNYYYAVLPKLDVSAGLRYKSNNVGGAGIDSSELFYNLGLRGELTPKLTSEIQAGYIELNPDTGSNKTAFGLKANLAFAITLKSSIYLEATNQFGYSGAGQAYKAGTVSLRFDTELTNAFLLSGNVFWNTFEYTTTPQSDDFTGGQIAGTYKFNEHAELRASYTYSDNDSNIPLQSFKNSIVSLSATLKY